MSLFHTPSITTLRLPSEGSGMIASLSMVLFDQFWPLEIGLGNDVCVVRTKLFHYIAALRAAALDGENAFDFALVDYIHCFS